MNKRIYIDIAKNIVTSYLSAGGTTAGVYSLLEINVGNKLLLLEHIKAIRNICTKAAEILEEEIENGETEAS